MLTRISRKYFHIDVTPLNADGQLITIPGVDVALLPIDTYPSSSTVWTAVLYSNNTASVLLAGPDATLTAGAMRVTTAVDVWIRVTDNPEIDAQLAGRVRVIG